jgi:hypothetical protein
MKAKRGIIALGDAALECDCPVPVTLALTDPIVADGTPAASTNVCAFEARAANPTETGFARKTV